MLTRTTTYRNESRRGFGTGLAWAVALATSLALAPTALHAQESDSGGEEAESEALPAEEADPDDGDTDESSSDTDSADDADRASADDGSEKRAADAKKRRADADKPADDSKSDDSDDGDEASEKTKPALMHAPVGDASAGSRLSVSAAIQGDWRLDKTHLAARPVGSEDSEDWKAYPFERADSDTFVAEIPGEDVQPPGLEYYIASSTDDGHHLHYASPDEPHPVVVHGETEQTRRQKRLDRHGGFRSTFELRGEMTQYGGRLAKGDELPEGYEGGEVFTDDFTDQYWKVELEYTYRLLSTLYDIRFGLGVMRGEYPTATVDNETVRISKSAEDPGLNYGYGMATFEFIRNFSVSGKLMLGASGKGFAPGAGAVARIGRLGGTHAEIAVDIMADVGSTQRFAFRWDTVPRVPMAFIVERSDWPSEGDNPTGSRIMYELGVELSDPLEAGFRAGLGTRSDGTNSGFIGGLHVSYSL